jgi:hypothetical protein
MRVCVLWLCVSLLGTVAVRGQDWSGFAACAGSPGSAVGAQCAHTYDSDSDSDVDLADAAQLQIILQPARVTILPNDPNMQYVGRVYRGNPLSPKLGWAGTAVIACFEGTSLATKLSDNGGNAYFMVRVDDGPATVLDCAAGVVTYTLASGLPFDVHKVELFKRTEANFGQVTFCGFTLDPGCTLVAPPARPPLKIEFYGDSVTNGLALESSADEQTAPFENAYQSYAAQTARALGAEYSCIAVSGIGLMSSWWNETMPANYYYRHDPGNASSNWDFSQWQADVVVVNLGQNDYWTSTPTPTAAINGYVSFARTLRGKYPAARIILALGSMNATQAGSPWPGYIESAVAQLNTTYGDAHVYSLIFPYCGLNSHPHLPQHTVMANSLTTFIQNLLAKEAR